MLLLGTALCLAQTTVKTLDLLARRNLRVNGAGPLLVQVDTLRRRHANFSLIKAEATADDAARLKAMAGPDFMVFNGRGGLDMIACLDGGCDGFVLAPDLSDYSARVIPPYDEGRREEAVALHHEVLPAITFIMRSLENLICYGKRAFAQRAGLEVFDRAPALRPESAELAEMKRLIARLEPFPLA